jgi:hypothetical protein
VITRTGDITGASGSGLLAAVLFDAVGEGSAPLTLAGTANDPSGAPITLQFSSVTITAR